MKPRTGPKFHTTTEAKHLAANKLPMAIIQSIELMVMMVLAAGLIFNHAVEGDILPIPKMGIYISFGACMVIFILPIIFRVPQDPVIAQALKTRRGKLLFTEGDQLELIHENRAKLQQAVDLLDCAFGLDGQLAELPGDTLERAEWVKGMNLDILRAVIDYNNQAQTLHERQCALLDPAYKPLGIPNPLKHNS